jgi:hypothetical protein
MKTSRLTKEDVQQIANDLKMVVNDEIIDMALEAYDDYREQYPNDDWQQIVETMLYDYFNNLD